MYNLPTQTSSASRTREATRWPATAERALISHAHARLLAWFWEEPDRPDDSVTVLARTGAIRHDAEQRIARDLELLTLASDQSSDPGSTICQMQVSSLLHYVQRHGQRDPVAGWTEFLDDGEFRTRTSEFVRTRRQVLDDTPRTKRRSVSERRPANGMARHSDGEADIDALTAADAHRAASERDTASDAAAPPKTVYEQLGGAPAVRAAVDVFYDKVLEDQRIAHFFKNMSMTRLKAHQRAFITAITGGDQDEYADMDAAMDRLRKAHERLKITRHDFNLVVTHLVTTLAELGVATELVEQVTPKILQLREAIVSVGDVHPFHDHRDQERDVTPTGTDDQTLYDRIGGADAITAAVDLFYKKVLGDDRVNGYFGGINVGRLKAHQRAMFSAIAGGPNAYSGRSMHEAHAHLRITNDAFDVVVNHLVATLQELGVAQEEIDRMAPPVLELRSDIVTA